jgi:type IV secretory pathway VirB10-like protein
VAGAATLSGCSLLFVKGPPTRLEPGEKMRCTTSYAGPVVDGIVTGLEVARTIYATQASDATYAKLPYPRSADIALGVGLAGLYALSMGVGISRVGDCNEVVSKFNLQPASVRRRAPAAAPGATPHWGPAGVVVAPKEEDEEDEESAAQARARAKAAADAKAAGEAARRADEKANAHEGAGTDRK